MLEEGKAAPAFSLQDQNGNAVALKDFKGKKQVVLFCYPKAMTPGCTTEAKDFTGLKSAFGKLDAELIGISPDSVERQKKFQERDDLDVLLLADPDKDVLIKYGFFGEKKNYGRTVMGVIRSTAIIGKDGKVRKLFKNIKAKGHAERVLKELSALEEA